MKKLIVPFLLCCGVVFGGVVSDKDTIPLKKSSPNSSDKVEGNLLAPKKGAPAPAVSAQKPPPRMPQPSGPYIAGIDTFGSTRINETMIRNFLGKDLDKWIEKGLKADPTSMQDEARLKERVKAKWGFPVAEWSIIQYFEPGDMAIFITLDVIEPQDLKKRMAFLPEPTGTFKDPGNLLASWSEYENKAMDLVEKGQLEPQAVDCAALHCPFGHKHAALKKYEKVFVDGVKKYEGELVEVLAKEKNPEARGAAAYLLAYLKDGRKVVDYLVGRIKDPSEIVRNNSLRVLGDIAEFHREYVIPLKPVLEALYFPRVSDRSKAIYVAYHMATYSQTAREEILRSGVPDILKMLDSKQPDHREFAHGILRRISGKEFPPTDLRAWNSWWEKLSSERGIAKKP